MKLNQLMSERDLVAAEPEFRYDVQAAIRRAYRHDEPLWPFMHRLEELKRARHPIERAWKLVHEYLIPDSGVFDKSESVTPDYDAFELNMDSILDSKPMRSLRIGASGIHGGLTSPSTQWFTYYIGDYESFDQDASWDVKAWIYNAQVMVRDILSAGNFYAVVQSFYRELLAYGTAVMMIYSDRRTGTRFEHVPCGTYWIANDSNLRIDTLYRRKVFTAYQIAKDYGIDNCPKIIRDAIKNRRQEQPFYVVQCIQPWNYFGQGEDHPLFAFEDVRFVDGSGEKDSVLYRGGYETCPFVASRWQDASDHVYGRTCPGFISLPDNVQLQLSAKDYNLATAWKTNPAWLADASAFPDIREDNGIFPGRVYSAQMTAGKHQPIIPLAVDGIDLNANIMMRQALHQTQDEAYFTNLFSMIQQRTRGMTATEVMQLIEEKTNLLGPIVEQVMSEALTPTLERCYDIGVNVLALLPPPPPEIAGREIKPYFTSALATAQRQAQANNLTPFFQAILTLAQANPEVLTYVDWYESVKSVHEGSDAPAALLRSEVDIESDKAAAAQAQQQQAHMAQAGAMADAAKNFSKAKVSPDNALGALMGAV